MHCRLLHRAVVHPHRVRSTKESKKRTKAQAHCRPWASDEAPTLNRININVRAIQSKVAISVAHGAAVASLIIDLNVAPLVLQKVE